MKQVLLTLLVLTLAACGKDDEGGSSANSGSVDDDGNCKSAFLSDHNSIVHEAEMLDREIDSYNAGRSSKSAVRDQVNDLKRVADQFKNRHSGVNCTASENGRNTKINADELYKLVEAEVKSILDQLDG